MNSSEEKTWIPDLSEISDKSDKNHLKLLTLVVLLSFLFGVMGALFGANFLNDDGKILGSSIGRFENLVVNEESATIEVVKKASPAVVSIIVSKDLNKLPGYSTSPFDFGPFGFDPFFQNRNPDSPNIQEIGGGSGFIITSDGLIITNKHVVEDTNATYSVLTNDGKNYDATVLSRDPVNDVAILKINVNNLSTLPLGDSSTIEIGQRVIAIGNSLGQYQNTVTTGVVSGIGRTINAGGVTGTEQLEGVIQTDAAINPGNSGGPLLDLGGSVIGMNTAIDSEGQLVGFAIPVNDIKKDVESFQRYGTIKKPFLGIRYVLVNDSIKEENKLTVDYGALICACGMRNATAVIPGSAADKAGLKENDIILEVNGTKIGRNHSLAGLLKNYNPSDEVKMIILSNNETKEISATLGETP